jgi:hypothetical protein
MQKMISYASQDSLLVGRLRKDAGNGHGTRHRTKNDEEVSLSLRRAPIHSGSPLAHFKVR